jgi:hypothetical protein
MTLSQWWPGIDGHWLGTLLVMVQVGRSLVEKLGCGGWIDVTNDLVRHGADYFSDPTHCVLRTVSWIDEHVAS